MKAATERKMAEVVIPFPIIWTAHDVTQEKISWVCIFATTDTLLAASLTKRAARIKTKHMAVNFDRQNLLFCSWKQLPLAFVSFFSCLHHGFHCWVNCDKLIAASKQIPNPPQDARTTTMSIFLPSLKPHCYCFPLHYNSQPTPLWDEITPMNMFKVRHQVFLQCQKYWKKFSECQSKKIGFLKKESIWIPGDENMHIYM